MGSGGGLRLAALVPAMGCVRSVVGSSCAWVGGFLSARCQVTRVKQHGKRWRASSSSEDKQKPVNHPFSLALN